MDLHSRTKYSDFVTRRALRSGCYIPVGVSYHGRWGSAPKFQVTCYPGLRVRHLYSHDHIYIMDPVLLPTSTMCYHFTGKVVTRKAPPRPPRTCCITGFVQYRYPMCCVRSRSYYVLPFDLPPPPRVGVAVPCLSCSAWCLNIPPRAPFHIAWAVYTYTILTSNSSWLARPSICTRVQSLNHMKLHTGGPRTTIPD